MSDELKSLDFEAISMTSKLINRVIILIDSLQVSLYLIHSRE
jgi:hypothetical protein